MVRYRRCAWHGDGDRRDHRCPDVAALCVCAVFCGPGALLAAVEVAGYVGMGAQRWISLGIDQRAAVRTDEDLSGAGAWRGITTPAAIEDIGRISSV